jgi:hypothetical protein
MAIVKISELPDADTPLSASDVVPALQNGVTRKAAINQFGYLPPGSGAVTRTIQAKVQETISVKDFGAVGDGVADDTAAIQTAINSAANKAIFFPAGTYRTTGPLYPASNSKFIGEDGATGAFSSFVSTITYDPPAAIKSTLAADINTTVTTIDLADASGFPSSGIIYLSSVNGEYVKYTGKSGNSLTGCSRGYWGGIGATSGDTPSGVGESYLTGTGVWLLRPVMLADGVFSGTIQNLRISNAKFVSQNNGFADIGLALYFNYAAYGTILRDSLIRGFEKAMYCGRSFVTTIEHPMVYNGLYGIQIDGGNGAVVSNSDFGVIGVGTLSQRGWCYYLKNGAGCSIFAGNLSNGGLNTPIISDNCDPVIVKGVYVESHKDRLFIAQNSGVIYADGIYSKESNLRFGDVNTNGVISINNISHRLTGTPNVRNLDDTGYWSVTNSYDIDANAYDSDKYGIGTAIYQIPHITQATSPLKAVELRGQKAVPDNTATPLFNIGSQTIDPTLRDISLGITVDYYFEGDWASGYGTMSEKATLQVAFHHRTTLTPATDITKIGVAQVELGTAGQTLTLTFTAVSTNIVLERYSTVVNVTATSSGNLSGTLFFTVKPSNLQNSAAGNSGFITLL